MVRRHTIVPRPDLERVVVGSFWGSMTVATHRRCDTLGHPVDASTDDLAGLLATFGGKQQAEAGADDQADAEQAEAGQQHGSGAAAGLQTDRREDVITRDFGQGVVHEGSTKQAVRHFVADAQLP